MTRFLRHPDLRLTSLEDEGVVLHLGARRYFTVTGSALALLEAMLEPSSFDDLVTVLTTRYEVTAEQAAASVRSFLARCREANLVLEQPDE